MKKLIIFSVIFSAVLVGCSNFNDIETVGINNSIGAFIGWKIGSTIGGITLPVIGYIPGGVVGAVSVGVSSAVAGWKAGGISIKVSWSK